MQSSFHTKNIVNSPHDPVSYDILNVCEWFVLVTSGTSALDCISVGKDRATWLGYVTRTLHTWRMNFISSSADAKVDISVVLTTPTIAQYFSRTVPL